MLSYAPDYNISVSNYAASWLKMKFGVSSEVIYNGVNTKIFRNGLEHTFRQGNPQLLFVGNLYRHKGVIELLEAIKCLTEIYPEVVLYVVGDGPARQNIINFLKQNGLTDRVFLKGRVSESSLVNYYASSDLYVTASRYETYGLPLIEAMSTGKPFVASSIPPHIELAKASRAGLIYQVGNTKDLIEKIVEVNENREVYIKNSTRFATEHNWSSVTKKIVKIYDSILQ
jgi:glycosyltransferase involved in cell wall biosynthesis